MSILPKPIPMVLHCPKCGVQHIDRDEWVLRLHRTHLCLVCKHEWRPAQVYTVGVEVLNPATCTGVSARWCPNHGTCTCPPYPADLDSETCPLHAETSLHAEDAS